MRQQLILTFVIVLITLQGTSDKVRAQGQYGNWEIGGEFRVIWPDPKNVGLGVIGLAIQRRFQDRWALGGLAATSGVSGANYAARINWVILNGEYADEWDLSLLGEGGVAIQKDGDETITTIYPALGFQFEKPHWLLGRSRSKGFQGAGHLVYIVPSGWGLGWRVSYRF
jgi:hypothetical protein